MTDFPRHTLSEWEQRALEFTPAEYFALLDIEKVEVQIARAKVAVNAALYKLEEAAAALPYPMADVDLHCEALEKSDLAVHRPETGRRKLYLEEHPEYLVYMRAAAEKDARLAGLSMFKGKLARMEAAITKKQSKRKSRTGGNI